MTQKVLVDIIHDNGDPDHRVAEMPVEYLRGSRPPGKLEGKLVNLSLAEEMNWRRQDVTTVLLWRGSCYSLSLTDKGGSFEATRCSMGSEPRHRNGQTTV
ncbi:MAG: hypothetical protein ABSB82_25250 [Terriglobia bacterium]|jgi:hypothetical protein